MFSLHERTRRRLCIAGFVVFCVLPILCVLSWSLWKNRPSRVDELERAIARQIGLRTRIDGVSDGLPGVTRLHELRLTDPRTEQVVIHCPQVEVTRSGSVIEVVLDDPTITGGLLERLGHSIMAAVEDNVAGPFPQLRIVADSIVVREGAGSRPLAVLVATITKDENLWSLAVRFQDASVDTRPMTEIKITRQATKTGLHHTFTMDTGNDGLPTTLLAAAVPELKRCGADGRFHGTVRYAQMGALAGVGTVSGRLSSIDPASLFHGNDQPPIAGDLSIHVNDAQFVDGRLVSAHGQLSSFRGTMSPRLWDALQSRFGASPLARDTLATRPTYDALAIRFTIEDGLLHVSGCCQSHDSRIVLDNGRGDVLMHTSESETLPLTTLADWLTDGSGDRIPWNRDAAWLLGRLPFTGSDSSASLR